MILLLFGMISSISSEIFTNKTIGVISAIADAMAIHCIIVVTEKDADVNKLIKGNTVRSVMEPSDRKIIRHLLEDSTEKCTWFVLLNDLEVARFLNMMMFEVKDLFNTPWYILMNPAKFKAPAENIGLNSDVNILLRKDDSIDIIEVYHQLQKSLLTMNVFGRYSEEEGFTIKVKNRITRRSDLGGKTLKVITFEHEGYTMLEDDKTEKGEVKTRWVGIFPEIMTSIANSINASIEWSSSRDGNWGTFNPKTNSWNGAIKDLMDNIVDLSSASFTISQLRSTVVDFSIPIVSSKYIFMVGTEPSFAWDIYYRPFHWLTWLSLIFMILLLIVCLAFVVRVGKEKNFKEFTLSKCMIFVFGAYAAIASRRWSVTPVEISGRYSTLNYCIVHNTFLVFRVLFISILLGGGLIHWFWKASLISHLSVVTPFVPFSSLEGLLSSSYQITTLGNSVCQDHFENAKSGIFKDLWESKFKDKSRSLSEYDVNSGRIAAASTFAHYIDVTSATYIDEYKKCKLQILEFTGRNSLIAFAFPKNSSLLQIFNMKILEMFENGEINRIISKYTLEMQNCQDSKGKPLGFENISIIFVIIGFGVLISISLCLAEHLVSWWKN